jgi:hypothetical protein
VVVENGGVQDHLIDIALQGVFSVVTAYDPSDRGLVGRAVFPIRGGNGIAIDIERLLLFGLGGRRRSTGLRHGWAWQAAKQENR